MVQALVEILENYGTRPKVASTPEKRVKTEEPAYKKTNENENDNNKNEKVKVIDVENPNDISFDKAKEILKQVNDYIDTEKVNLDKEKK